MPETGAKPNVPKLQRRVLRAVEALTSPLLPSDYLELINPLWSTRELRGRIERIEPETADAATVVIKPGYAWMGHRPGQYLRIGVDIEGVRHWRAYSITSEPGRADGCVCITVKHVDEGKVSPHLVRRLRAGAIVSLGGVEGDFVLPQDPPERLLFVSAGSGITPIMSMLRSIEPRDAVLVHSARGAGDVIFGDELRALAERRPGFVLHEQDTARGERLTPEGIAEIVPDWREREAFVSGPGDFLDALVEHWEREGDPARLHLERFQPKLVGATGEGGTIAFLGSDTEVEADGATPILVAGEEAGLELPFGCREGICHTCVGTLRSGRVRDLRNGEVGGQDGQPVRTCINAAEGRVEIEL
jgi:ferredoxin-NADP reductase